MGWISSRLSGFLRYKKLKYNTITDKRIVLLYRITQATIIIYIFGYILLYEKGYQKIQEGDVVTTAKLKGVIVTNFSDGVAEDKDIYTRVWDSSEYASTSSESRGFFVATNVIITPNQTLGKCDEDPYKEGANCTDDIDCTRGLDSNLGNGHRTGRCIPSTIIDNQRVCEITAWCPVEHEKFPSQNSSLLSEAAEFSVFIRSEVYFHQFGQEYKRNNILKTGQQNYLEKCRYDSKDEPYCPVFSINYMVKKAEEEFKNMSILGGVIVVNVKWNCNLDHDFTEYCKPKYKFRRVDDDGFNEVKGYSFRKAYHHDLNRRSLVKYHGIMFIIRNEAIGRKFSFIKTVLNIAIGLALLRLSILLPNFTLWVMKRMNTTVARIDKDAGNAIPEESQEMSEKHEKFIP